MLNLDYPYASFVLLPTHLSVKFYPSDFGDIKILLDIRSSVLYGEKMPELLIFIPLTCFYIFFIPQTFSLEPVTIFFLFLIGCNYLKYTFKVERALISHQAMHHLTLIYTSQIKP